MREGWCGSKCSYVGEGRCGVNECVSVAWSERMKKWGDVHGQVRGMYMDKWGRCTL